MSELLNDVINIALNKLSSEFVYRKLGLCYDYPTLDNTFPLKTLPKADETCNNLPNNTGNGTGMFNCILNNALLFDGYATRFEVGFETEQDTVIYDRLIGGTIRLGTVAPKNVIVRGLTGDGRYFYSDFSSDAALLWAFTTWRTVSTTTVAIDSQLKLVNISSRWINKLQGKDYKINEDSEPIDSDGIFGKLKLCAILALCSKLLNNQLWLKEFTSKFTGEFEIPEDATIDDLLIAQLSLYIISEVFVEDEKVKATTSKLLSEVATVASRYIEKYKDLDIELLDIEIDTNWRDFKDNSEEFTPTQKRFNNEKESVTLAVQAMYILLLSKDVDLINEHKDSIIQGIKDIPWDRLTLATSLSGIAAVHARGVEYKLWDTPLQEYSMGFSPEASLVADYLTDDYDETHENKAGHVNAPKKKPVIEIPENEKRSSNKKKRKRRRRPKSANATANNKGQERNKKPDNKPHDKAKPTNDGKKDEGSSQPRRSNNKNKRNRRRRPSQPKTPPQNS